MSADRTASYTLRYMLNEDVPQVVEIDRLSFPSPWPTRSYSFEINDNSTSHMVSLVESNEMAYAPGLRGMLQRISGQSPVSAIVGYAGMWLIAGEAHVSTIAVHPSQRGRGLGEVLLNTLLNRALVLGGEYSVLEVRVGNTNAKSLYLKYGYEDVGTVKNYYRDNQEDATMMHLAPLDEAYRARLAALTQALRERVTFTDMLAQTIPDRPAKT